MGPCFKVALKLGAGFPDTALFSILLSVSVSWLSLGSKDLERMEMTPSTCTSLQTTGYPPWCRHSVPKDPCGQCEPQAAVREEKCLPSDAQVPPWGGT